MTKHQLFEKVYRTQYKAWRGNKTGFFHDEDYEGIDPEDIDENQMIYSDVLADKYPHKITSKYDLQRYDQDELERIASVYPDGSDREAWDRFFWSDNVRVGREPTQAQAKSKKAHWKKAHNMTDAQMYKLIHLTQIHPDEAAAEEARQRS